MKLDTTKSWIKKCLLGHQQSSCNVLTQQDLRDITNETLLDLRSMFEHFVDAFNDLKSSLLKNTEKHKLIDQKEGIYSALLRPIHIYNVVDKENGFMLFRQGHRLILTPAGPGHIQIQLMKKENEILEKLIDASINAVSHNIMSIHWIHSDHKGFVDIGTLSRYYMKQFLIESEKFHN